MVQIDPKKNAEDPANAKSMRIFMKVGKNDIKDETTERALIGFFMIWAFASNQADFTSDKINKDLVLKLHRKEVTISHFVKHSMKDEISSKVLLEEADSFAKYYYKWKYTTDAQELLGQTFTCDWTNYKKVKAKINERFAYWKKDKIKAQEEKLQEEDPTKRAGQLSTRDGSHIFEMPPHPKTTFDDDEFLTLLEGSISLTMEEKKKVIEAIPRLSIEQINELFAIFRDEKQKFAELENEFGDDVAKLKQEREKEIQKNEDKKKKK